MTRLELRKLENTLLSIGMTQENVDKALETICPLEPVPDYKGFSLAVMAGWPEPWGEGLDGFELQELAAKFKVLKVETRTTPCGEGCNCSEYCGDGESVQCYRPNWGE